MSFFTANSFGQCFTINSYPYTESFETGTGNWFTGGTNNDWAWGTPSKPVITGAGAGVMCWITGGPVASFYNLGERSWVQGPCFDFTTLNRPYISFLIFWETERTYDGGNFQYSIDGGTTWVTVGNVNESDTCSTHNWFNASNINNLTALSPVSHGWSGTINSSSGSCNGGGGSGGWKRATHCLDFLAHKPNVKFRFTFGSGTTCNDFDGLAFDDIYIGEAPSLPADFKSTCIGADRIKFEDLSKGCHDSWLWDFGDPGSSNNSSTQSSAEHIFSQGGIFNITMSVTGGCAPDTQVIKQLNILSYTTQVIDVTCNGGSDGSALINISGNPTVNYAWSHDPALNSPSANGLTVGHYTVEVTDTFCSVDIDLDIGYSPLASPVVTLGDDTTICPGGEFLLKPGSFTSYEWQDHSNDSVFLVSTSGLYSVNVLNSAGCAASDSIIVIEDCLNDIIIPNAFTPNGDGINEMFFVNGSATSEFEIFVFDRWGEMIFRSPDRDLGWDGTAKGRPVQEGFYNYLVNYSIGNEERVKTGSVFIIR